MKGLLIAPKGSGSASGARRMAYERAIAQREQPAGRGHQPSPPKGVRAASPSASVLALQRTVGNLATGAILQRTADESEPAFPLTRTAPPVVREVLRSPGQALDPQTRAFMEPHFGHDFSRVRIHADPKAAESAEAVDALAFTVGRHIVFGPAGYAPHAERGRRLLAHELAHVTQQGMEGEPGGELEIAGRDDPGEVEARRAADAALLREAASQPLLRSRCPCGGVAGPDGECQRCRERRLAAEGQAERRPPLTSISRRASVQLSAAEPLRPPPAPTPRGPVPSLRVIEGGLSRQAARSGQRTGWRFFWRAVARRFAVRGAAAAVLAAADGPLPIGDLISLGLALWTIWEIVQLWDALWGEAVQEQQAEGVAGPRPQPGPTPGLESWPVPAPEREREPQERCRGLHPYALVCSDGGELEEVAVEFLMAQGRAFTDLGDCYGIESFSEGTIDACDGSPGERWHCRVNRTPHEISVFGCLCCNKDGATGFEWRGAHWSVNLSRR